MGNCPPASYAPASHPVSTPLHLCPLIRIYTAFSRPGNAEAYLCTPMKLDKSNTNYLVGFEPTAHKDTAHHMILYGCKSPARQEAIYNCGGMDYLNLTSTNVCPVKIRSKHSSNTLLCLLRIFRDRRYKIISKSTRSYS